MNNFNSFVSVWLKGNGFAKFCLRIAFITLVLGSFALTLSFSVIEGFHKTILDNAFKYDSHLKVQKNDKNKIENSSKIIESIETVFPEANIYPLISQLSLVKVGNTKDAFFIKGIPKQLIKDRYELSSKDHQQIFLPSTFYTQVKHINDIVFVFNDKHDINFRIRKKKISGEYIGGFGEIDKNTILCDLESAKEIIGYEKYECDEIEIVLKNGIPANSKINELSYKLGYEYLVQSYRDIHWLKIQWIEVQKDPISIALALISLVAISNIITGLLVLVVDKFKSIGLLRSLGLSKIKLLRIFFTKGLQFGFYSSLTGYLIGLILGLIQNHFQIITLDSSVYFINSIETIFEIKHFLLIILSTSFISATASLIPAYLAMKMEPINAIRSI